MLYLVIIEASVAHPVDRPHRNVRSYPVARWNLNKEIQVTPGYVIVAVQLLDEEAARPYMSTAPQEALPENGVTVPDPERALQYGERRSMWR